MVHKTKKKFLIVFPNNRVLEFNSKRDRDNYSKKLKLLHWNLDPQKSKSFLGSFDASATKMAKLQKEGMLKIFKGVAKRVR